ncbi:triose-phosphate isomerase [Oceanobacillus kapialis]|uniref:Triosephosphate isomerase n=1 Tax=Oceanobacillus kapialis TaxID=481353 RepID=A0ABW5Q3M7_9BACI
MRKPVVGISYKTYINSVEKASSVARALVDVSGMDRDVEQVVFPSLGVFSSVAKELEGSEIAFGAQNISPYKEGAYTGEVSIVSIKEQGGQYVEIGHAERKRIFHETQDMINLKTKLTLESGLIPFLCIGEEEKLERKEEKTAILKDQISQSLHNIEDSLVKNTVLAYEPVWAIGQAEAADATYVHQTHEMIRDILEDLYGKEIAEQIRVIYGGSVSKDNAPSIVSNPNVDGVFIGRFGHDPANFRKIVDIVKEAKL